MDLRETLVTENVASPLELDEALARQVLYGQDLVTNLLELVDLDERRTQAVIAKAYGCEAAPSGELPYASAKAIELVPREMATKLNLYPYRLDDDCLTVITSEPLDQQARISLGFSLKVELKVLIALSPRVKHAIARDYAFALDRRTQKAIAKLDQKAGPVSNQPEPLTDAPRISEMPRPRSIAPMGFPQAWADTQTPIGQELTAETVKQPEVRSKQQMAADLTGEAPKTSRSFLVPEGPAAKLEKAAASNGQAASAAAAPAQPNPAQPNPAQPAAAQAASAQPGAVQAAPPANALAGTAPASAVQGRRRRGPYTTAQAKKDLRRTSTPQQVLEVYFDYAAQYFDHAAAFTIKGNKESGDRFKLRATSGMPDVPSTSKQLPVADYPQLKVVVDGRRWLSVAIAQKDPALAAMLGLKTPHKAVLLPINLREHCVLVLFGAFGNADVTLADVGELLAFEALVTQALEHAIRARKNQGPNQKAPSINPPAPKYSPPPAEQRAAALTSVLTGAPLRNATTRPAPPFAEQHTPPPPAPDYSQAEPAPPADTGAEAQPEARPITERIKPEAEPAGAMPKPASAEASAAHAAAVSEAPATPPEENAEPAAPAAPNTQQVEDNAWTSSQQAADEYGDLPPEVAPKRNPYRRPEAPVPFQPRGASNPAFPVPGGNFGAPRINQAPSNEPRPVHEAQPKPGLAPLTASTQPPGTYEEEEEARDSGWDLDLD